MCLPALPTVPLALEQHGVEPAEREDELLVLARRRLDARVADVLVHEVVEAREVGAQAALDDGREMVDVN